MINNQQFNDQQQMINNQQFIDQQQMINNQQFNFLQQINNNQQFNDQQQMNNNQQFNDQQQMINNQQFNDQQQMINNQQFNDQQQMINNQQQMINNQQFNDLQQFNNMNKMENNQQFHSMQPLNNMQQANNAQQIQSLQINNNVQSNNYFYILYLFRQFWLQYYQNMIFQNNNIINYGSNNPNNFNSKNENNNNYSMIKYPHKSGLKNIGQTCYMNATVECLSNIRNISDYFLRKFGTFNVDNQTLTASYSNLIFQLFMSQEKAISPNEFKNTIGELNPLFKGMHAADAKDLVFFLIERLHKENNELENNPNNFFGKDFNQLENEATNESLMIQNFKNDFHAKNKSIISDTFYGITRSTMKCNGCGITKYSFQSFNLQIFQLKKLKEDKIASLGQENYDTLTLNEAFVFQQKEELLNGENMIYCNNCKRLQNGAHQQSIYEFPNVLIIVLNRGRNNQDFNEEFDYPENLDFTRDNIIGNSNSHNKKFYLCGIIKHLGESGSAGHFIAYSRNNMNDKFMCYNDSHFYEVSAKDAMSATISYNDNEKKTPYVLFYHSY